MSRRVDYLNYIANGGNINDLPLPMAPEDYPLYKIATGGVGGTGALKNSGGRVSGYYSCLLNSDAGAQNFCSTILDLGETKRVNSAKVRAKFVIKNGAQATLPIKLGLRLFANNDAGRNFINGYKLIQDDIVGQADQVVGNKEFVLEKEFTAQGGQTSGQPNLLSDCRYLKPFITLTKSTDEGTGRQEKHLIYVYEVTIEIDGVIYDITDTVCDFAPRDASKITYVDAVLSEQASMIRSAPWHGKTVACIGDSITFGLQTPENNQMSNPWVSQLRNYCGFTNTRNYGISSTTVANATNIPNWDSTTRKPMSLRYTQMSDDADVVIFKGGVNDFWLNVPLGTFDKTGNTTDVKTYYGSLNVLFKGLKEKYPNKTIVAMTLLNYNSSGNIATYGTLGNANGDKIEDFRQAIRDVAKLYNINVFELQNAVGFDAFNEQDKIKYIPDGLHPNQAGADIMAKVIGQYINSLA